MVAQTLQPMGYGGRAGANGNSIPLQYRPIVPSPMMSVTDIRDGRIQGYFLSRLLFVLDQKHSRKLKIPEKLLFTNAFASLLAETDVYELFHEHGLKVDFMQDRMKELINTGLGYPLVHTVLVQQLDYLAHTGSQKSRSRKGLVQGG